LVAGVLCCPRREGSCSTVSQPRRSATCGLDILFIDAGDGCGVHHVLRRFVVVGAALIVEAFYQPPFWLHAVLWLPLILIATLGPLRPMKGLMIALQYHHRAAEGRLERKPGP
jgi:uncharacterized protein (DUF983 family)